MIFVTVGTDLPFDRLMRTVDQWALARGRKDVFAQIGEGGWKPTAVESAEFLEQPEFTRRFNEARVIVAHAGMGTILSALLRGKPIVVLPRRASLGEQRNEHQLATARHLQAKGKIHVAYDETELTHTLDQIDHLQPLSATGPYAEEKLLSGLRHFIHGK